MDPCKGCDQEKPICCSECDVARQPEASCGTSKAAEGGPVEVPDCEKCKGLRQEIEFLRAQLAASQAECERLRGASKKAEELGARIVMDALENRGQWGICDELYNQKARDEFIRRALGHDAAADGAERGGR